MAMHEHAAERQRMRQGMPCPGALHSAHVDGASHKQSGPKSAHMNHVMTLRRALASSLPRAVFCRPTLHNLGRSFARSVCQQGMAAITSLALCTIAHTHIYS